MVIAGSYTINGGDHISARHRRAYQQVTQAIASVAPAPEAVSVTQDELTHHLARHRWCRCHFPLDYRAEYDKYLTPHYANESRVVSRSYGMHVLGFVKSSVGLELCLNAERDIGSLLANTSIFSSAGVIDCGIIIVPTKRLAEKLSLKTCFEQFVWDLEHRGVSNIDVPTLIFGIDTDGIKPTDLKIAERKAGYSHTASLFDNDNNLVD